MLIPRWRIASARVAPSTGSTTCSAQSFTCGLQQVTAPPWAIPGSQCCPGPKRWEATSASRQKVQRQSHSEATRTCPQPPTGAQEMGVIISPTGSRAGPMGKEPTVQQPCGQNRGDQIIALPHPRAEPLKAQKPEISLPPGCSGESGTSAKVPGMKPAEMRAIGTHNMGLRCPDSPALAGQDLAYA